MEDTLRVNQKTFALFKISVLILVLMEDTLRELKERQIKIYHYLNPCFNGRYSQRAPMLCPNKYGMS